MDGNMITLGDFNMPHLPLNRFNRKNISKDMRTLNAKLEELGLMDI